MTVACTRLLKMSMAIACLSLLVLAASFGGVGEGPPPCEPPAGFIPPEVDVRIVALMPDQLVGLGTTHDLRAEALGEDGAQWGERFDWYVSGEHEAMGREFAWTVTGPRGDQRVTLVVTSGDVSTWSHVDVMAGSVSTDPPSWLGPTVKMVPLAAIGLWVALVYRQMARRRGGAPPDGSG